MSRRKGQLLLTLFLIVLIFSIGTLIVEAEESTDEIQKKVEDALMAEFDFDEI